MLNSLNFLAWFWRSFHSSTLLPRSLQIVSTLNMQSDPGDFIGQGATYSYALTNMNVIIHTLDMNKNGLVNRISFYLTDKKNTATNWSVNFATDKTNKELARGEYDNAQRASFALAGHPGLDIFGMGRGSNTLSPNLVSFAASFEQHSEGKSPALKGTIYYKK